MKASVFCGVSVDGFIARLNGDLDFLPEDCEPHGYTEFMATVDVLVMGRLTYEKVLTFGAWPFVDKRVVILSSRPLDLSAATKGAVIEHMSGTPAEIVAQLEASGVTHAYIDGGITIQRFLAAGLIQRMIVTRIPVLIGQGIPLFGPLPHDVHLQHVATRQYKVGLVQSEYTIGESI
jgi:dihydrofolate reductase